MQLIFEKKSEKNEKKTQIKIKKRKNWFQKTKKKMTRNLKRKLNLI